MLPRLAAVAVAVLALAGCSDDTSDEAEAAGPLPSSEIDRDAWREALVDSGGVRANPDLDALEQLTRDDCAASADDLALQFSLVGARPDQTRINMEYVCPAEVGKVDAALQQLQDAVSAVDEACAVPEAQRTVEQQQMVEGVGCRP